MQRTLSLVVSILSLLSAFVRAVEDSREIRLSPDGQYFVGWYDHDAGKPFGLVRPIVLRSVSDPYDIFSLVSFPRDTQAGWNATSTMCVISDAPDNGGPNTWLIYRNKDDKWASMKLDLFKGLYAEYARHEGQLFRPGILKISWVSDTVVSFHAQCNLGTYLITVDTKEADKKPVCKKLSDQLLEPTKGESGPRD